MPFHCSNKYNLPKIICNSYKSKMYHTKLVSNIVSSYLNRYAYNKNINLNINEKKTDIMLQKKNTINSNENNNNNSNKQLGLKQFPNLYINIAYDKLSVFCDISTTNLSLHGYKNITKKDSLKEHIASAIIQLSGVFHNSTIDSISDKRIIKNESKTTSLNENFIIWDPFCGCGTILIEAFLIINSIKPKRKSNLNHLFDMKFINECELSKSKLKEIIIGSNNHKSDLLKKLPHGFKIIGSDISSYALKASVENTRYAFKHHELDNDSFNSLENVVNENLFVFREKICNNFEYLLGDYQSIYPLVNIGQHTNGKINIISHLPYFLDGNSAKTKSLYNNFGKFLRKYFNSFQSVTLLIKKRDKKDNLNFINISGLKWDIVQDINNEGINTQVIKLVI